VAIIDPMTTEILQVLSEVIQRRGYLVLNSDVPIEIGHIFEWMDLTDRDGGPLERVKQPIRVMAETGRDDWNEQRGILNELVYWKSLRSKTVRIYYYRVGVLHLQRCRLRKSHSTRTRRTRN
jgi:hypothetical protein